METGHEHDRQNQTGEGELVGEVHGMIEESEGISPAGWRLSMRTW